MNRILILAILFSCAVGQGNAQNTWHNLPNAGITFSVFRFDDVYFFDRNVGLAVEANGRIIKTYDGGNNWEIKYDTSVTPISFRSIEFLSDCATGIAGTIFSNKVLRTTDTGNTWVDITQNVSDVGLWPRNICGLAHFGNTFYGVGWYGGDSARFYKSTDKGVTWQTSYIDTNLATQLVDVIFLSADTGFASGGINAGNPKTRQSVILKTTDGGLSWSRVFNETVVGGRIWKLQAINKQVIVGSVEHFFQSNVSMVKSIDGGNTWSFINTGISKNKPPLPNTTQGIGFRTEKEGWIGGHYQGLVHTKDGGQTWDTLGLGRNFNRFFVVDSNCVYAGGASVYRYGDSVALGIDTPEPPKPLHTLYPVIPNPTKGLVKIVFELKRTTFVLLDVVALDSRKSTVIVKARLSPGKYTYYWDSSNAAPGAYMVWMDTDEQAQTEKFILIR